MGWPSAWKTIVCRRFSFFLKASRQSKPPMMSLDAEKERGSPSVRSVTQDEVGTPTCEDATWKSKYHRWALNVRGLELRGIEPVSPEERQAVSASASFHILLTWFSMGMALNTMVVGTVGTVVMKLSFLDAALCSIFGCSLGCIAIGYICIWGPRSGHRTLVCFPFLTCMGTGLRAWTYNSYFPDRLCPDTSWGSTLASFAAV